MDLFGASEYALAGTVGAAAKSATVTKEVAEASGALVPRGARPLGLWGEARPAAILGGAGTKPAAAVKTVLGLRFHDRVVGKVAYEVKAGLDVQLTSKIRTQIDKDAWLVANSTDFARIEWHFFQGASPETLDYLTKSGLPYVLH